MTERALIAVGTFGKLAVVVATDGLSILYDTEAISESAEDIGLDFDAKEPGLYVWEGEGKQVAHGPDYEPDWEYTGTTRTATASDVNELLAAQVLLKNSRDGLENAT